MVQCTCVVLHQDEHVQCYEWSQWLHNDAFTKQGARVRAMGGNRAWPPPSWLIGSLPQVTFSKKSPGPLLPQSFILLWNRTEIKIPLDSKKQKKHVHVHTHTQTRTKHKQLGQTIQFTPNFLNPFWRHLQRIIILLLASSKFVQVKQSGVW